MHKQRSSVHMKEVPLPFRSPTQTSTVRANGCGQRANRMEMHPGRSTSVRSGTRHVVQHVRACWLHGKPIVASPHGENDTDMSTCVPESRPPTAASRHSVGGTSIPTCSDTTMQIAVEYQKHARYVDEITHRQDLYGNMYYDIVQLPLPSRGSFSLFHSQDHLECVVDHDIAALGLIRGT